MHTSDEGGSAPAQPLRARQMLLFLGLFVLLGAPLVYLIWRFVNELLLGFLDPSAGGLAFLGLIGLFGLLRLVAGRIRKWEDT